MSDMEAFEMEDVLDQAATAIRLLDDLVTEQQQQERKRQLLKNHLTTSHERYFPNNRNSRSPTRPAFAPIHDQQPMIPQPCNAPETKTATIQREHLHVLSMARSGAEAVQGTEYDNLSSPELSPKLNLSQLNSSTKANKGRMSAEATPHHLLEMSQSCLSDYLRQDRSSWKTQRPERLQSSFLVHVERLRNSKNADTMTATQQRCMNSFTSPQARYSQQQTSPNPAQLPLSPSSSSPQKYSSTSLSSRQTTPVYFDNDETCETNNQVTSNKVEFHLSRPQRTISEHVLGDWDARLQQVSRNLASCNNQQTKPTAPKVISVLELRRSNNGASGRKEQQTTENNETKSTKKRWVPEVGKQKRNLPHWVQSRIR